MLNCEVELFWILNFELVGWFEGLVHWGFFFTLCGWEGHVSFGLNVRLVIPLGDMRTSCAHLFFWGLISVGSGGSGHMMRDCVVELHLFWTTWVGEWSIKLLWGCLLIYDRQASISGFRVETCFVLSESFALGKFVPNGEKRDETNFAAVYESAC